VKDGFDAHFGDRVGMRTDEDAGVRDLPQDVVQGGSPLACGAGYGVYPDEHAVQLHKLRAHRVRGLFAKDYRLRRHPVGGQGLEHRP
jgi:hypothetical protein